MRTWIESVLGSRLAVREDREAGGEMARMRSARVVAAAPLSRALLGLLACVAGIATLGAPAASAAECRNEAVRVEQGSTYLPECRAYELVTPTVQPRAREGGNDSAMAARDGERLAYYANYPAEGAETSGQIYLSTRGAQGWSDQPVAPQDTPGAELDGYCNQNMYFSPELTQGLLEDGLFMPNYPYCERNEAVLVQGEPRGYRNIFLRNTITGAYQLVDITPQGATPGNAEVQAASTEPGHEFSHVVFGDFAALTPDAPEGEETFSNPFGAPLSFPRYEYYEWSDGTVRLITVLPDGTPVQGEVVDAHRHFVEVEGGSALARGGNGYEGMAQITHAVSANGKTVFFVNGGKLYARENAEQEQSPLSGEECIDAELACTVQIDASQLSGGGGGGGQFYYASADGSRVFFTDTLKLTASSTAVVGRPDLYEYDLRSRSLTDLTANATEPAGVVDFGSASEDGSYLYFVARGVLTGAQKNSSGAHAEAGRLNLYLAHEGALSYIATVPSVTRPFGGASEDGAYFLFTSTANLTAYDAEGAEEIYLYDAAKQSLSCVSCNPLGKPAPPGSSGVRGTSIAFVGNISHGSSSQWQIRHVLDTGAVLFTTREALVPGDTNGRSDVYEYASGQLSLITSGTADTEASLLNVSPSGSDVFFTTAQSLVAQDTDNGSQSAYDARVNGGFASPAVGPAPCAGEACREALSGPSAFQSPQSASFTGMGNQPPRVGRAKRRSHRAAGRRRKQRLERALKRCARRYRRKRRRRAMCERRARDDYGASSGRGRNARKPGKGGGRR